MPTMEDIADAALVPPETSLEERKHYRKVAGHVFRLLLANSEKTQVFRPGKIIIDKMAVISDICPRELPEHFRDWMHMFRVAVATANRDFQKAGDWGLANVTGTKAYYDEQHAGTMSESLEGPFNPDNAKQGGGGGGGGGYVPLRRVDAHPLTPTAKSDKPEASEKREACNICGLTHGGKIGECGMKGIHPDCPINDKEPFRNSQAHKRGMQLTPRMGSLSEVYNTQGEVMTKEIRQRLSDLRTNRQGKAPVPVPASKDIAPWGKAAAGPPGALSGSLPISNVYCVPCVATATKVTSLPFPTNTPHYSEELCACVSLAREGGAFTTEFSNTASVFLSPTTRAQARLRTAEESQQPRAAILKRGRRTAVVVSSGENGS